MKKLKDIIFASKKTTVMFVAGALLIVGGGVGGASATMNTTTNTYTATLAQDEINVQLLENGADPGETLLADSVVTSLKSQTNNNFYMDHEYTYSLSASNNGAIDTYTRVVIYKSWQDSTGKVTTLNPDYIELTFGDGWTENEAESTDERTVIYHSGAIAVGQSSEFVKGIKINGAVASVYSSDTGFKYNGLKFNIDARVQSVQTHNGADAVENAWGVSSSLVGA